MESSKAVARFVRVSPRKARLVVDLIRGEDLAKAQQILEYTPRAAARVVAKVLDSAAANAENNAGMNADELFVSQVYVDEGPTLKRFRPRAMGRATRINKRTSHVTVILEEKVSGAPKKKRRLLRRKPDTLKEKAKMVEEGEAEEDKSEDKVEGEKERKPDAGAKVASKKKPAAGKSEGAGGKKATAKKKAAPGKQADDDKPEQVEEGTGGAGEPGMEKGKV